MSDSELEFSASEKDFGSPATNETAVAATNTTVESAAAAAGLAKMQ